MARTAVLSRDTNETKVQVNRSLSVLITNKQVSLSLDGGSLPSTSKPDPLPNGTDSVHATQATSSQTIEVNTGIGFLDHVSRVA